MTDQTELGVWKNILKSSCVSYGSKTTHKIYLFTVVFTWMLGKQKSLSLILMINLVLLLGYR